MNKRLGIFWIMAFFVLISLKSVIPTNPTCNINSVSILCTNSCKWNVGEAKNVGCSIDWAMPFLSICTAPDAIWTDRTSGSWSMIPSIDTDVDCNGASCKYSQIPDTAWEYKLIKCESAGQYQIRCSDKGGAHYSSTKTLTCVGIPNATQDSPPNSYIDTDGNVTFVCNASATNNLKNISLIGNFSGTFGINSTNIVSGTFNTTNFTLENIADGAYVWNCNASDNESNSDVGDTNYTLYVYCNPPAGGDWTPPIGEGNATCQDISEMVNSLTIPSGLKFELINATINTKNLTIKPGGSLIIRDSHSTIWLNSNLTVEGNFTLDNSTMRVNSSYNGEYNIIVLSGGRMIVANNSNITEGEFTSNYRFWAEYGSYLEITDSVIEDVGWDQSGYHRNESIFVNSSAVIRNTTITDGYGGVYLGPGSNGSNITNNIFDPGSSAGITAILANGSGFHNISNNYITGFNAGGSISMHFVNSDNNIISENTLYNTSKAPSDVKGVVFFNSNNNTFFNNNLTDIGVGVCASGNGYGIIIDSSYGNLIDNNTLYDISECNGVSFGILVNNSGQNNTISNNNINQTVDDGIYVTNSTYTYILNNTIFNTSDDGIELMPGSDHSNISGNTIISANISGIDILTNNSVVYNNFINGDSDSTSGLTISSGSSVENITIRGLTLGNITITAINLSDNSNNITIRDAYYTDSSANTGLSVRSNVLMIDSNPTGSTNNIRFVSGTAANLTTINVTEIPASVEAGQHHWRKWWVYITVQDEAGRPVENANVTVWDKDNNEVENFLTPADGRRNLNLTEYHRYYSGGEVYFYYSNYTINATKYGSLASEKVNLTGNINLILTLPNDPPSTPTPSLTSENGTNTTLEYLNCSALITDANNDSMNVTVKWYNNSVLWMTVNYFNSYANGTLFNATLASSNTTLGDVWSCSIMLNDSMNVSAWGNSNNVTIIDTTPPTITWENPTPNNATITNNNYAYLNTTITDTHNTSAFIDWNRTLIGYWSMDAYNSTGIYDNSTYTHFAEFIGISTANITDAKYGKGVDLDGTSDYLKVSEDNSLDPGTDNWTVEVWAKPPNSNQRSFIISKRTPSGSYEQWGMGIFDATTSFQAGQRLRCLWLGQSGTGYRFAPASNSDVADGNWHHYACVFEYGNTIRMYKDGVELASTFPYGGGTWESMDNSDPLGIGSDGYGNYKFAGSIDEVRIYRRALSPEEINASYNNNLHRLYHNFTGLSSGTYNYTAYAIDQAGNLQITATRNITIDTTPPTITWENPTPSNDAIVTDEYVYLNTTITDSTNTSAFIDWNRSLVGYWSFDVTDATYVYDNSSYGHDLTFEGGLGQANLTPGVYGNAITMDGEIGINGDYLKRPLNQDLNLSNTSFTFMLWVNLRDTDATSYVLTYGTSSHTFMYIGGGGTPALRVGNGTATTTLAAGSVAKNTWTHLAYQLEKVRDKNFTMRIFVNGVLAGSKSTTIVNTNPYTEPLRLGSYYTNINHFNGSMDEAMLFRRALSPEEINASYNNNLHRLYHNFTNLSKGTYNYTAYAIDQVGNLQKTATRNVTINIVPATPSPTLTSENGTNYTTEYLNCSEVLIDGDGDAMNVSVKWYNNSVLWLTVDYNNSYANGTLFNATLASSNTTKGQNWTCGMQTSDGLNSSSWANSSVLIIANSPPVMQSPRIAPDPAYTNDTLQGYCNATDADGDTVNYYYKWFNESVELSSGRATTMIEDDTEDAAAYDGNIQNPTYAYDEIWTTRAKVLGLGASGNIYINYTIPSNVINAQQEVKYTSSGCSNTNYIYCYNGSQWIIIDSWSGIINTIKNISLDQSCIDSNNGVLEEKIHLDCDVNPGPESYFFEEKVWWNKSVYYTESVEKNVNNYTQAAQQKGENWTYSCLAFDGTDNASSWANYSLIIQNLPPNTVTPSITSENGTNYTTEYLNCSATLLDGDADAMNVSVLWYNNSVLWLTVDYNNSYANGTLFNATLASSNTTKGQNWSCALNVSDGTNYTLSLNSSNLTIANTPPSNVTLIFPNNGNDTLLDRTPTFNWSAATDPDNDVINYTLNVTCPTCSAEINVVVSNDTNYTPSIELDLDKVYYWNVTTNDGTDSGGTSETWNFTILSTSIIMVNGSVNFSNMQLLEYDNTSDDNPPPFVVENNGNVLVNVTVYAQSSLWDTVGLNTTYFMAKADNHTAELGSFRYDLSQTTYTPIQNVTYKERYISYLNYSDSNDLAELDIAVQVPDAEPAGNKSSVLVFEATASGNPP
ncbi:hypothetical protein D6745_01380 [Candidatus Woesearchaeota archaeon]|nr:MAG: hypothetical protein D6745_01380 [Candidatus Woesearchaeota archaeon]